MVSPETKCSLVTRRDSTGIKGFKKSKDGVTFMACVNPSRSIAMPIMCIHKCANPRCFKNLKKDLPLHHFSQENSWMDSTLFKSWFFNKPHCRSSLWETGLPEKALLLLDNALSYSSSETLVAEDQQIRCVFLPPNTTFLI